MKDQKLFKTKEQSGPKSSKSSRAEVTKTAAELLAKPAFTQALAREIVKNLNSLSRFTARPFARKEEEVVNLEAEGVMPELGDDPIFVDTSVLIDGRIMPIANSGFLTGTLLIPQFVLGEVQHIADSSDSLRRAKGRRGLEIANKLKGQRANGLLMGKVVALDVPSVVEVDHKLAALAKKLNARLLTVDFNLAHLARAQGVKVLNIQDIAQALKLSLIPGEELTIRVSHAGKEQSQGVGYLADGTMIIVDRAADRVGVDTAVVITKIHQTPAGQLFFARLK